MKWPDFIYMVLLLAAFWGCTENPVIDDGGVVFGRVQTLNNDSEFIGVPMKIWATYTTALEDTSIIAWEVGEGEILRRKLAPGDGVIKSDTIWVNWKSLPRNVRTDSGTNNKRYIDSVRVSVNAVRSPAAPIYVENLLPSLDSILVRTGFSVKPRGDSIYVRIHQGEEIRLEVKTTDLLKESALNVSWPSFMKNTGYDATDKSYLFSMAPTVDFDQTGLFSLSDGFGASKSWNMRFQTYRETGSIWVVSTFEMVKISSIGKEIFRINNPYEDLLIVDLNSSIDALFRAEPDFSLISKYSTLSFEQLPESAVTNFKPLDMASEGQFLWVAEQDQQNSSYINQYNGFDLNPTNKSLPPISGRILDIAPHPGIPGAVWYIKADSDTIMLATLDSVYVANDSLISNPKKISFDASKKVLWVTNGESVVQLNSVGRSQGIISEFGNAISISAGEGLCWVVDQFEQILYMYFYNINTERKSTELRAGELAISLDDPIACSIVNQPNPLVWVAENGSGSVVQFDEFGRETARYTGLINPRHILVNQAN